jgi:cell division protein FtsZ
MNNIGKTKIKVVGIGGGGSNTVSRIYKNPVYGISYLTINTDLQDLRNNLTPTRLLIGNSISKGRGLGGNINEAKHCFESDTQLIKKNLSDADLIFIASGMGGGTGTVGSVTTAKLAKESGSLVISVVTSPFAFEGKERITRAKKGLLELEKFSDILINIPNDIFLSSSNKKDSIENNFKKADEVIDQSIRSISELITLPGDINLDFADVKTIISDGGHGKISSGKGYGKNKAREAIESALLNPLLDVSIYGAKKIIFNVVGGEDMTLEEVYYISDSLKSMTDHNSEIIFGTKIDPFMEEEISLTFVATGFPKNRMIKKIDYQTKHHISPEIHLKSSDEKISLK